MRGLLAVVFAIALTCSLGLGVGMATAAHEEPDRTIFGVELSADGDAQVYNVTSYDLSDDEQRAQYESLEQNETARNEWRDTVAKDLEAAAEDGRNVTDLEMRIQNVTVETNEVDGYGRIVVTAEWERLAFAEDHRVVVWEPFRSGFEPGPTRVAVHGPDGYERSTVAPDPVRATRNTSLWNPQTSEFSQFYAEFTDRDVAATASDGGENSSDSSVGVKVAFQALFLALVPIAAVLLALRRR